MSSGSMPAVRIARSPATAPIDAVVSWARRPGARGCRSATGSTRRTCRPSARGRRWSGPRRRVPPQPVTWASSGRASQGSTSMSGCLALTNVPLSGTTRTTRPARSDLISLKSFIASMSPTTWPTATSRPTSTNGADPGGRRVPDAGERRRHRGRRAGRLGGAAPRGAGTPPARCLPCSVRWRSGAARATGLRRTARSRRPRPPTR